MNLEKIKKARDSGSAVEWYSIIDDGAVEWLIDKVEQQEREIKTSHNQVERMQREIFDLNTMLKNYKKDFEKDLSHAFDEFSHILAERIHFEEGVYVLSKDDIREIIKRHFKI